MDKYKIFGVLVLLAFIVMISGCINAESTQCVASNSTDGVHLNCGSENVTIIENGNPVSYTDGSHIIIPYWIWMTNHGSFVITNDEGQHMDMVTSKDSGTFDHAPPMEESVHENSVVAVR